MKARFTISIFSLMLSTVGCAGANEPAPASVLLPAEVVAYVHSGPPKTLSDQIMGVARKVVPGHQTEFLPMMVLSFLGYPEFPGISSTDPMGLFLFDKQEAIASILVLRMDKDSPLRKTLPAMGWVIQDNNGWTFIASEAKTLADFCSSANQKAMVAATVAPLKDDLECTVPERALAQAKPERWLASLDWGQAAVWRGVCANRMRNLKYTGLGVSFKETSVELSLRIQARPKTPEAIVLSQPAGGAVGCAQYFSTESALVWAAKGDPKGKWNYLEGLLEEAKPLLPADKRPTLDHCKMVLSEYFKYSDGTQAGALDMRADTAVLQIAHGGTWSTDTFMAFLKTYEMSWPELYAAWQPCSAENASTFKFTGRLKPADFMVGQVPVHLLSLEAQWTNPHTGLASKQWATLYNALYNGSMVQANACDAMKSVLNRFIAGKPVVNSADKVMSLPAGTLARGRWDLVRYTSESVGDVLREQAPGVAESLQRLKSEQLPPIEMDLQVGQAQGQLHVSIPICTLQKLGSIGDALKPDLQQPSVISAEPSATPIHITQPPAINEPS